MPAVNAASAVAMKKMGRRNLFIVTMVTREDGAGKARAHRRRQVPFALS
jgi:hypothetical protein